ncbi:hypothetical protein [Streptacidiphilus sp. PAMC 29251]|jgi:hypothetical protein
MRAARLIAGSAVALAALSMAAPIAQAADGGGTTSNVTPFAFKIYPTTVKAGGNIGLGVSGCDATSATASAGVFDTVTLPSTGTKGEYVGAATIDADAKPGAQYDVKFTCGSSSGTTTLTVAAATSPTTTPTTVTPTGAVKTGLGGGSNSDNSAELAAGGALAVLALGGLGLAARRRAGNHG